MHVACSLLSSIFINDASKMTQSQSPLGFLIFEYLVKVWSFVLVQTRFHTPRRPWWGVVVETSISDSTQNVGRYCAGKDDNTNVRRLDSAVGI